MKPKPYLTQKVITKLGSLSCIRTVFSSVLQTMKISTLLFQTAALVGAMSFTKAQEGPSPLGSMTGFIEPAFQPPVTDFSLAIEGALTAFLDSENYQCEPGVLDSYTTRLLEGIEDIETFVLLYSTYRVTEWLFLANLFFNNDDTDDVFGRSEEQTVEFRNRFLNMKSWGSDMDDAVLKNFNGQLFKNTDLMINTLQLVYFPTPPYDYLYEIVTEVQGLIESDAGLGYDSPIWSLNALATSPPGFPDQIHFGDGILDFFEYVDIDDGGPDFILSHEFGHLIQFNLNVVFERTPESTRKTELMADALSAYYLVHEDGAAFQNELIEELTEAAFHFGDCAFDSPGHHGTPNQRKAATAYGARVATESKSTILSPAEFVAEFNAYYDTLIAPDSPVIVLQNPAATVVSMQMNNVITHNVCENFAVHARTTVTFDGVTSMIHGGDVSVSPGTSVTGSYSFSDGGKFVSDSSDFAASVMVAYAAAMVVRADEQPMAIEIGGSTFTPGTHRSDSAINFAYGTVVTLDGLNEPNPVFLFQANSTLVTAADTYFNLVNGAKAENILWALGTAATLGANSTVEGSILTGTAITFGTKSVLHGCALAQSAVTFESEGSVDVKYYEDYEDSIAEAGSTRHLRGLN
jgi:hypothetical protein